MAAQPAKQRTKRGEGSRRLKATKRMEFLDPMLPWGKGGRELSRGKKGKTAGGRFALGKLH